MLHSTYFHFHFRKIVLFLTSPYMSIVSVLALFIQFHRHWLFLCGYDIDDTLTYGINTDTCKWLYVLT